MRKTILIIVITLVSGCLGMSKQKPGPPLSQTQALRLAVFMANERCQARFKLTPFDTSSYTIVFQDNLWRWGGLDLAGISGYSAQVMFDAWGKNQNVEVYLSIDSAIPISRESDLDDHNKQKQD
jgi:hypothetical protein